MAFSTTDLAMIDRAIASGTLSVTFADGREVRYQNGVDLRAARDLILSEINASSATAAPRTTRVVFIRA